MAGGILLEVLKQLINRDIKIFIHKNKVYET